MPVPTGPHKSYQGLLQNTILPRLGRYELTELTPPRLKQFEPHYTRVFLFMSTNSGAVQSNSTAVFLFVDRKDSLVQSQERSPQGFQSPGRIFGRGSN